METIRKKGGSGPIFPAVLTVAALILSLLPLLLIARYDQPCGDDYQYGLLASQAWAQTGSFPNVLAAAGQTVRATYLEWQGSFSAVFLMALQPGAFGDRLYFLAPLFVIAAFLGGTLLLFRVVLKHFFHADLPSRLILFCVAAGMPLHFMPSPVDGLFWYNGAVYYTFFYSLSLVLFSLVFLFYQNRSPVRRAVLALSVTLLGLILGGGNFTTALVTPIVLLYLAVYGAVRRKRRLLIAGLAAAADLAGLLISASAPGNAVRQSYFTDRPTAFHAVLQSFRAALVFLFQWTNLPVLVCIAFLVPVIYRIVRASEFSFPHPWLVPLASFCAFSAQFTPPLFALGSSGPERLLDIIYCSYFVFLLVNLFYLLGWISKQLQKDGARDAEQTVYGKLSGLIRKNLVPLTACFALLFVMACVGTQNVRKISGVSAFLSLRSGQAAQYGREADARLAVYRDPSVRQARFAPFSVKPYLLYTNDVTPDPDNWRNVSTAAFFGKESVVLNAPSKR